MRKIVRIMLANVLMIHGGDPTAVINASLYGVVEEAKKPGGVGEVYRAIGGNRGIPKENFLDLIQISEEKLDLLFQAPTTTIGSSQYALEQEDHGATAGIFRKYGVQYVFLNGGSGIMDTCNHIFEAYRGEDIYMVGIPETIDNDTVITDHIPRYGSAAGLIAASMAEVGVNVRVLPIHVCAMEAVGRNTGWMTAVSALAKRKPGGAPHLIYLLERPFHEEELLEGVKRLYEEEGDVVAVASEGFKNEKGEPVAPPIFKVGRTTYYGDVSAYLTSLIIQKLEIRARNEKPDPCGGASIAWQSPMDREGAVLAGREVLRIVMAGRSGAMIGLIQDENEDGGYHVHASAIPIKEIMLHERVLPGECINDRNNSVTGTLPEWCRPLIGPELGDFVDFKEEYGKMGARKWNTHF